MEPSDQIPAKKTKFDSLREAVDPILFKKWDEEQKFLRNKLIDKDDFTWMLSGPNCIKYVGGLDISFCKEVPDTAVSYLVVLEYPSMKVLYKDHEIVQLDLPYVPGFLAFREAPHLLKLIDKLKNTRPDLLPQAILIDGNGILHQNGFGLASHLGVLCNIPTIGCSKTVFYVDGLSKDKVRKTCDENLKKGGDYVKLIGDSGKVWGAGLKSNDKTTDPIIVSIGHKISLDTAIELVKKCCKTRVPEPVRQADLQSREIIRKNVNKIPFMLGTKNEMKYLNKESNNNAQEEDDEP